MSDYLFSKRWFRIIFKGGLVVLFSILTLSKIMIKPFGLAYIFGMLMMFSGLLLTMHSLKQKGEDKYWWIHLIEGLIDLGIGIALLLWPDAALLFILLVLFSWTTFSWIYYKKFEKAIRTKYFNFIFFSLMVIVVIILGAYIFYIPTVSRMDKILLMGTGIMILGINLVNLGLGLKNSKSRQEEVMDL